MIAIAKNPNSVRPKKGVNKKAGRLLLSMFTNDLGKENAGNLAYSRATACRSAFVEGVNREAMPLRQLRHNVETIATKGAMTDETIRPPLRKPA